MQVGVQIEARYIGGSIDIGDHSDGHPSLIVRHLGVREDGGMEGVGDGSSTCDFRSM